MGQRYINHEANGTHVVLFVRSSRTDVNGRTRPTFCAGRARYIEHRSERPMQITWELHDPLPGDTIQRVPGGSGLSIVEPGARGKSERQAVAGSLGRRRKASYARVQAGDGLRRCVEGQ
jgi:hypothetical protein